MVAPRTLIGMIIGGLIGLGVGDLVGGAVGAAIGGLIGSLSISRGPDRSTDDDDRCRVLSESPSRCKTASASEDASLLDMRVE